MSLLPHQTQHAEHLLQLLQQTTTRYVVDGSDAGTGKTHTTAWILAKMSGRACVVAPKSVQTLVSIMGRTFRCGMTSPVLQYILFNSRVLLEVQAAQTWKSMLPAYVDSVSCTSDPSETHVPTATGVDASAPPAHQVETPMLDIHRHTDNECRKSVIV